MPTVYLNPAELKQVLEDAGLQNAAEDLDYAVSVLEIAMQNGYDSLIAHLGVTPLSSFVHGSDGNEAPYVSMEWDHADAIPYELLPHCADDIKFADNDPDSEEEDCEDDDPEEFE